VKTSDQILSWASDEDDDVVAEADTVDDRDRVVVEMVGDVALSEFDVLEDAMVGV